MFDKFINKLFKHASIKHLVKAKLLLSSSVVCYTIIRPVICAYLFTQVTLSLLLFTDCSLLSELFFAVNLIELLAEVFHCYFLVLRLFSRLLRDGHDASRYVCTTTSAIGFVDMLSTRTLSSHVINTDILHVHCKLTRYFRYNENYSSA